MFLNKVFIWTINKKAFRLEGYVVCFVSVYTNSCCLPSRVCTELFLSLIYLPLFFCRIITKVKGWKMLTFLAIAFREVTRLIVNVLTEFLALNVTAMFCHDFFFTPNR